MAGTEKSGENAVESGIHDPKKTSPIVIEKFLAGISFPANKETLIQVAKNNTAPDTVIELLNKIADEEYSSVTEIAREVAEARNT